MQIIPIKKSRELVKYAIDHRLKMAQMTEQWGPRTHQIKAGPGSCCLFSQEHIHGSGMPNETGRTRISMDFRIAEGMYGDLLGRKIPAGYFHLIPDAEEEEERLAQLPPHKIQFKNGKQNIFYVANNALATDAIPVHLRRYTLYDYCNKKGLSSDYELFDLEDMLHCPTLLHLIGDRNASTITYGIFALPEDEADRNHLLGTALRHGNIIHFVNEDLQLSTEDDLQRIRRYLDFGRSGRSILPIGLPLSDTTKTYFNKWSRSLADYHARRARSGRDTGPRAGASPRFTSAAGLVRAGNSVAIMLLQPRGDVQTHSEAGCRRSGADQRARAAEPGRDLGPRPGICRHAHRYAEPQGPAPRPATGPRSRRRLSTAPGADQKGEAEGRPVDAVR